MRSQTVLRGYRFRCICGLWVTGSYPLSKEEAELSTGARVLVPLDPTRAVCRVYRGKAAGQPLSVVDDHDVGCGRTLEKVLQELDDRKGMGVPAWAKAS